MNPKNSLSNRTYPKNTSELFDHRIQGCEGRSSNEVSVFFDMLTHPGADLGMEGPPLVDWRRRRDLAVDHVVLGKGRPGGCWEVRDLFFNRHDQFRIFCYPITSSLWTATFTR